MHLNNNFDEQEDFFTTKFIEINFSTFSDAKKNSRVNQQETIGDIPTYVCRILCSQVKENIVGIKKTFPYILQDELVQV